MFQFVCALLLDFWDYMRFLSSFFEVIMGFKRPIREDGDGVGDGDDGLGFLVQDQKRRPPFKNVDMDVLSGISIDEMVSRMEPMLRRAVREEVERGFVTFLDVTPRTSLSQVETSEGRILQLLFVNKLPSTIFTGTRIVAEDGEPILIELIDPISKKRVTSGPYSSIKIQILVLNGDFGFEDHEIWTEREFGAKVVRERDGRRPLVTGELNVTFRDGVGIISDIIFTDNSSWIRCRKFRLGARVLQSIGGQVRIKEAKSEAFVVKDHRGELYKKHYPPLLEDEVWRLEKIAKDGKYHTRLTSHNICSVKDFLRLYVIDPNSLKRMLDCSNRAWDTIVEHASTCGLNDEIFYTYSVEGISLLFNCIYKLVAATFDGQNYQFLDDPTFTHKHLVETIKKQAYRNVNSFVQVDRHAIFGPSNPLISLQAEPYNSPTSGLQRPEFQVAHAGIKAVEYIIGNFRILSLFWLKPLFLTGSSEIQSGFDHASPSTSYNYGPEDHGQQSHFSVAENTQPIQVFDPMCSRNYSFKWTDLFPPCIEEIIPNLASEIMSQAPMSTWSPVHNNGILYSSVSGDSELGGLTPLQNFGVHISTRNGKTKAAWCKIRAVLKWRSVGRDLAAKRMARPFYVNSI
ncbi:hypothetical protein Dsin_021778 [Dipteronia sinensis]|uniref:Calmodulin-binding protein n=1 Tax=Dipteronia sinensis TaxID=43782 RepID=A0AAE0A0F1_9ROSI|nr:hypothetical protein Dsin_021778 [Dipteronia sinensis]